MTRLDALLCRIDLPSRSRALLGALLVVGCYDPASADDESTAAQESSDTAEPSSSSSDASTASTSATTTPAEESSSADDDGSSGESSSGDTTDDTDSGESSEDSSSGDELDTTAPQIVSISPETGAVGVHGDVDIVITFDEPMDAAATEAAFSSADLGTYAASWSGNGTMLIIDPDTDLAYANGSDPADVVAAAYAFAIAATATDVAGNPIADEVVSSFSTARRITATLVSDAALVGAVRADGTLNTGSGGEAIAGDRSDDSQVRGFMGLVLDDVPADAQVESATLDADQHLELNSPYATMGDLGLFHITADALDADAFGVAALADLGVFSDSGDDGPRTADITTAVAADLAAGRSRALFRLQFPIASDDDGSYDLTRYDTQSGSIVYLIE